MKNIVVEFFQNLPDSKPEQFNKAFELYRQTPTKSHSVERVLNVSGYSDTALNNLLYDLQKLHDISDVEKLPVENVIEVHDPRIEIIEAILLLTPQDYLLWLGFLKETEFDVENLIEFATTTENESAIAILNEIKLFKEKVDAVILIENASIDDLIKDFEVGRPTDQQLQETVEFALSISNTVAVEKLNEIIEVLRTSVEFKTDLTVIKNESLLIENEELKNQNDDLTIDNEDLQVENEDLKNKLEESASLPKITNQSIRTEFPFLNEKECPNELKILVADKIRVWNDYLTVQEEISKAESGEINLSKEDLEIKAKFAVICFEENQKIYDELNAFKETGKVLGKHPLFRTLKLSREVEEMSNEQLINYKNSTAKFFSVNKASLEKAEKAKDLIKIKSLTEKIESRNEKLALVNKKLGV